MKHGLLALVASALSLVVPGATSVPGAGTSPQQGITAADRVARAYDLILDANFDELKKALPNTCPPAPQVAFWATK